MGVSAISAVFAWLRGEYISESGVFSKLELMNAGVIDEDWASSSGLTTGATGFAWRGGVGGMYGIVIDYRLDHQHCLQLLITGVLTGGTSTVGQKQPRPNAQSWFLNRIRLPLVMFRAECVYGTSDVRPWIWGRSSNRAIYLGRM